MDIRAADWVGRTVKVDPGNPTCLVGRLASVRHKWVGRASRRRRDEVLELERPEITTASAWLSSGGRSFFRGWRARRHRFGLSVAWWVSGVAGPRLGSR
jgi:hypothetical protein